MQVVNNEQKFKVYWMYNDQFFPAIAKGWGLKPAECEAFLKIPLRKQVELWNKMFPSDKLPPEVLDYTPDTTWCFIADQDGKVICEASVHRYHKDTEDRDKARKYSLAKALNILFPFDKEARKQFWLSYLKRHDSVPKPKVTAS